MVASSIARRSCRSNSRWLKISEAAQALGVSQGTVRNLCNEGEIEYVRLPSGHRRISQAVIDRWNGTVENDNYEGEIGMYCRVSSTSQNCKSETDGKSSLDRQVEAVLTHIEQVEGIGRDKVRKYIDVNSSFSDRKALTKLIMDIIDGKVRDKLYIRFWDRLSRIPGQLALVEHICERFGIEIIAIEEDEDKTAEEEFTEDILGFITVYANKNSSRKAVLVIKKEFSKGAIERAIALKQKGYTPPKIVLQLKKEGYYCENAQGKTPISIFKLRSIFDDNGNEKAVNLVVGAKPVGNSAKTFISANIVKTGGEKDKLLGSKVYPFYVAYCKGQDILPEPPTSFGLYMREILGEANYKNFDKANVWLGWEFRPNN